MQNGADLNAKTKHEETPAGIFIIEIPLIVYRRQMGTQLLFKKTMHKTQYILPFLHKIH